MQAFFLGGGRALASQNPARVSWLCGSIVLIPKSHLATPEVDFLDTYFNRRLLRWAGHVSRMPISRVPRNLLASWVAKLRPIGPGAQQGPPSCRRPFHIHQVAGLRCIS